jgi:hypothetical protein
MRPPVRLVALLCLTVLTVQPAAAQTPSPEAMGTPVASPAASVPPLPPAAVRIIELQTDPALRILRDGEPIFDIAVVPGETVIFSVSNTAGFAHNFFIGSDAELSVPGASTEVGIPAWSRGTQEFEWTVPDDISGLMFGCTVPGHYQLMRGTFSVAEIASPVPSASAPPQASLAP